MSYFADFSSNLFGLLPGTFIGSWPAANPSATDEISREEKRLAYEIKQSLGIKGFTLSLAGSSTLAAGFSTCWDTVRPCLETPELDEAVAHLRGEASRLTEDWSDPTPKSSLRLTPEETVQLQVGLDFYQYLLPKMLILLSGLRLACEHELQKNGTIECPISEDSGAPDDALNGLFQHIRKVLCPSTEQVSARMARVWSGYLVAASGHLRPSIHGENFRRATKQLHEVSRRLALGFKDRMTSVETDNLEGVYRQVRQLESRLPSLIVSLSVLQVSFRPSDLLATASKPKVAEQSTRWHRRSSAADLLPSRPLVSNRANQFLIAAKCLTSHQPQ